MKKIVQHLPSYTNLGKNMNTTCPQNTHTHSTSRPHECSDLRAHESYPHATSYPEAQQAQT